MKFSLIICGYNEAKNLDACIQSCLGLKYPKDQYEIIYVDNNSTDESFKIAEKYAIKTLREKRQGLSEARNCGIKNSKGEILVFLDADLKLDADYLEKHLKTFIRNDVGAGGGMVLPLVKTWVSQYQGVSLFEGYPRYIKSRIVRSYPGCNLSIRRSVIDEIGFFKENLVTSRGVTRFGEDKEICERIRKNGYEIFYNAEAIVYHENIVRFWQLVKIWVKGARSKVNLIDSDSKELFSLLFRYNIPIFTTLLIVLLGLLDYRAAVGLIIFCVVACFMVCIRSFLATGLFFQSFFIKPWMDVLSLITINSSVLYLRWKKWALKIRVR